jgi:hypothetical protein
VQQNLKYQDSSATPAVEDATTFAAEDPAGTAAVTQVDIDSWCSNHPINVRLTVPLPFARYYLTIVGGKERRNPNRRDAERRQNPLATKWNIIFLGVLGLITGLALFTAIQFAARFVLENAGVV